MKKTAILCCKIFDLLYGWNALKGRVFKIRIKNPV